MQALPLPIDACIPEILAALRREPNLVLEAPPGAGKTTRVPSALLDAGFDQVLVLEPRRIAARMAARRVATERNERLGDRVGYQVRFEEVTSPQTRLRFVTEGVLTRRLLSDPELRGVEVVVLDEFHERHLDGDLALSVLHRLQRTRRPELRLVVMSATLNAGTVSRYLGGCPVLRSEGSLFEINITHQPESPDPLEQRVLQAVRLLLNETRSGDVLVFLPGAAEIRRCARVLEDLAAKASLLVMPLHGDLSPEEQDRAVMPAGQRKVILSTNVAESSITIEGVTAVVDSGLARIAGHSPWSGLPVLRVGRVSQASCRQRAGRAGRMGPGRVIRLYPAEDFARRPDHDTPEILRSDLSPAALSLHAMHLRAWEDLDWLDDPPAAAVQAATELLRRLGAIDGNGKLTPAGHRMSTLLLHPRLARLLIEAEARGAPDTGCAVVAVLSSGQRMERERTAHGSSDLLHLAESEWDYRTRQIYQQVKRLVHRRDAAGHRDSGEAIQIAALTAFPDRVARRRSGDELLLAQGGSALLAPGSVVRDAMFMVAVDVEERQERGLPLVRLASAIEPEWLLDLFPERILESNSIVFDRNSQRVEAISALFFDDLVLEENRHATPDSEHAAALLAEKAWEAGIERFASGEDLRDFLRRVAFAAEHGVGQPLGEEDVRRALAAMCVGRRSFRELESAVSAAALIRELEAMLAPDALRQLAEVAPARIRLPGGRQVKVHYETGKPPWIASRLQDFFGMKATPRVARGVVPLVIHLLAPNQRPVQMTTDLAGFWQRLYPQVRRELCRRYPKHAWPEDPLRVE
jgi:ATP-dependent helicase HrpB